MALFQPPSGRAVIEDLGGRLTITIPGRWRWLQGLFMAGWLGFWSYGGVKAFEMFSNPDTASDARSFVGFWLIAWAVGWVSVVGTLLWMVAGKEIVRAGSGELSVRLQAVGVGWTRTYELNIAKRMRVQPPVANDSNSMGESSMNLSGLIAFDYGAKTVRFGRSIDEAEAYQLVELFHRRFPNTKGDSSDF